MWILHYVQGTTTRVERFSDQDDAERAYLAVIEQGAESVVLYPPVPED